MRYVLQVVLSNAQHPEYGQATIPFPIPNQNYDSTIELLGPLEIGDTPQIPEPEIAAAVLRLYHKLKLGQETVLRPVLSQLQELRERELRSNRKISDIDNEIARISEQNLVLVRLKLKGYVDSALYLSQMDEIDRKLRELRKLRRRLLEAAGEDRQIHDTERMMEYLEDGPEWLDEVPAELFGELIERIIIIGPERLKFRLLNGMELAENIERTVR